jgi:hypothetical protein
MRAHTEIINQKNHNIMKNLIGLMLIFSMFAILSCGPSAEEIAPKEKARADSIAAVEQTKSDADKYAREEEQPQATATESPEGKKSGNAEKADDKNKNEPTQVQQKPEQRNFYDSVYVAINSNRKLIKTANLIFSVKDVEKATTKIEQIAYRYGGFTLKSGITKTTEQASTIRINNDSVLEVGIQKVENNIVLRVPHFLLDSTLMRFSEIWLELNERTVNAEDVTIDYLANDLRAKIHQKTAVNINRAAQNNPARLDEVVEAERVANQFLETSIQKQIENMTFQDKVDYATITLNIYQDDVFYKKKMASYKLEDYEPGFGSELVDAFVWGWNVILSFILFLAQGWSVMLIIVGVFLAVWYFIRFLVRRKKAKSIVK